jgi:hypothetical protein
MAFKMRNAPQQNVHFRTTKTAMQVAGHQVCPSVLGRILTIQTQQSGLFYSVSPKFA